MPKNTLPDNKERDAIIAPASSAGSSPKRGDLLNGSPKTKSISGGGANYSPHMSSKLPGAPPPNNPYRKDEK
jgi:hypothetical protein